MGLNDLNKIRERAPVGLDIVRNIITTVELGMQTRVRSIFTRGHASFGGLDSIIDADVSVWYNRERGLGASTPNRVMTVLAYGNAIDGRGAPGIVYNVKYLGPLETPVVLPGDAPDARCDFIELAGESERRPLLFGDGELDSLSPDAITRRLQSFQTLASIALDESGTV
jgi:hypothetical protein